MMGFLQTGRALYVLAVICFGGIFVRLAAGSFYKKLIKESANMALTKNRYLRNLKQNAEDTYRINMGMNNAAVYLQRQLGNLKFLGFSLSGLENLAGQLTLLSFLAGGVCAFLSYWNRSDNSYIVLYGAAGILGGMLTIVADYGVNLEGKRNQLLISLQDHLENVMWPRLERESSSERASAVTEVTNKYAEKITENQTAMTTAQKKMDDNSVVSSLAAMDSTSSDYTTALAAFVNKVQDSQRILDQSSTLTNAGAMKIDGCDSEIKLNGITYTSSLNTYSINGLSITAMQATGDGDTNAITVTTATDTQAIYDKIKSFLTQYNSLINEMTSLYNADTAKGYEPLTDDEKSAMSDSEVEKWEEKIKSSLLRRDDSLESVMNLMTNAMSQPVTIDGKKYYLSSFGIKTLGFLNAPENQQNAYHIDGDEDDTATSGNEDKLMAMINSDPDTVVSFMQQLTTNLYDAIGTKMKSSTLSSIYKVYNDKEMASEYSDYTTTIKKWEQKLQDQEDAYYKKFSAMETALSKLQSQTSSLSNLFGG